MMEITIREFDEKDAAATARLFFESVRRGAATQYSEAQRQAWAPDLPDPGEWRERLGGLRTWIAEVEGKMAGFMSVTPTGHLDLAFVHPDWIGTGVARALYGPVEQYARQSGLSRLTSDASLLARPFFERQGWQVLREQQPVRNGVVLTNFRMEKKLD